MQRNIDISSRASFKQQPHPNPLLRSHFEESRASTPVSVIPTKEGRSKGFTLVELIVVVVILGILSTVGFVSYSSYLAGTRDTNRISQLTALHDGLELYRTEKDLPLPDDYVEVKSNGTTIAYQGYAGEGVLETIDFTKGGKDPKDSTYFSYYLTSDKKYFQLLAFLEEEENLLTQIPSPPSPLLRFNFEDSRASTPVSLISLVGEEGTITPSPLKGEGWGEGISWLGGAFIPQAHAATDYTSRYPTVNGHKLGILTESGTNAPIQEVTTITNSGYLDIALTTDNYKANLTDTKNISGTGLTLITMIPDGSCKRIKEMSRSNGDGVYTINPTGSESFKVYCDMTTEGGGWTLVALANTTTNVVSNNVNRARPFTDFYTNEKENILDLDMDSGTKGEVLKYARRKAVVLQSTGTLIMGIQGITDTYIHNGRFNLGNRITTTDEYNASKRYWDYFIDTYVNIDSWHTSLANGNGCGNMERIGALNVEFLKTAQSESAPNSYCVTGYPSSPVAIGWFVR